jgi:hypothetical protein
MFEILDCNQRPTLLEVQDSDKSQYPPHYYILVRLWGKLVTHLPNPIFNKRHKKCITLGKKSQLSALSTFAIFWLHTNLANQGSVRHLYSMPTSQVPSQASTTLERARW